LNPNIEEVQAVPESIDYINKFLLMKSFEGGISWFELDKLPYIDYQLLIVMTNAYGAKMKAGKGFTDRQAIGVERSRIA
jgi:hypothetical protein